MDTITLHYHINTHITFIAIVNNYNYNLHLGDQSDPFLHCSPQL